MCQQMTFNRHQWPLYQASLVNSSSCIIIESDGLLQVRWES